jgi:hypothetical protein
MKSALGPIQKAVVARIKTSIEAEFTGLKVRANLADTTQPPYVLVGEGEETDWSSTNCEGSQVYASLRVVSLEQDQSLAIASKITELLTDRDTGYMTLSDNAYLVTWRLATNRAYSYDREEDRRRVYEVMMTFASHVGRT